MLFIHLFTYAQLYCKKVDFFYMLIRWQEKSAKLTIQLHCTVYVR